MATDRQGQATIKDILVNIGKDHMACASWDIDGAGPRAMEIDVARGVDAMDILQSVVGHDLETSQAAQAADSDSITRLSFACTRIEDYGILSRCRLGRAPGVFISMDNIHDLLGSQGKSLSISRLTFWIPGAVMRALASAASLQQTPSATPAKNRQPGRL